MSTVTSVLIVQNAASSGPGLLPEWLSAAGATSRVVHAYEGEPVPATPDGHDAVILLGGGLMPDDDETYPWLPDERALAQSARDRGAPVLGICLGGQLITHTFGGAVQARRLDRAEAGVVSIDLLPAAENDPLLRDLPTPVPAVEHHEDAIIDMPGEATLLASTARCPIQAFRLDQMWAVQFHPEAPASRVSEWDREELRAQGYDPDELVRSAQAQADELNQVWSQVISRFVELAAQRL